MKPPEPIIGSPSFLFTVGPSAIEGLAGFAALPIARGTRITEYLGERISKTESIRRCAQNNQFIINLSDELDLDGNLDRNLARFFNHSCRPNCEAILDEGRIWIVATTDLLAGEELTFNYGYDLEDYRAYPCRCGSSNCIGYIVAEAFFDHVRKQTSP